MGIRDEGGTETKPVFTLDCVGAGIVCTQSGITGTLTVVGATASNSFATIDVPAGTDPVASSATDTLTITETSFLTLTGTAATDTLDITQITTDLGTDGLIAANAVALGTDTTGNYVATVADDGTSTITVANSGTETAAVTLKVVDVSCTNCLTDTEVASSDVATALAADPADCATSTHFAVGVVASGAATCEAIADADVPDTITVTLAATATALAANGANCTAGNYPLGVDASGAVESCTAAGGGSGITRSIASISTPTTAGATAATDYVYFVSGTTTLTLPTAVGNTNLYTVKNTGSNTVTIATTSAQTIDGSATITLPVANTSVSLLSNNSNWFVN